MRCRSYCHVNPIALRLAHIREEQHDRRKIKGSSVETLEGEGCACHRNEIICIGKRTALAVLALADAIHKNVVVVEYDPMKINTVKQLYNQEKRQRSQEQKSGKNPPVVENLMPRRSPPPAAATWGVTCEYGYYDPECWEELEMDQAFKSEMMQVPGTRRRPL